MENERLEVHDDDSEQCIHHWLINQKNFGVCKKCGVSKQFCASWYDASTQKASGNRGGKAHRDVPGTKSG